MQSATGLGGQGTTAAQEAEWPVLLSAGGQDLIPRLLSPSLLRGPFCPPAALRRKKSDTCLPSPARWSWKPVWAFKPSPTLLPPHSGSPQCPSL